MISDKELASHTAPRRREESKGAMQREGKHGEWEITKSRKGFILRDLGCKSHESSRHNKRERAQMAIKQGAAKKY